MLIDRNDDNSLPSHAWPGGYPLYYTTKDGGTLCPACSNGENGSLAYAGEAPDGINDSQWAIVGQGINYEDMYIFCDHCNSQIPAAYAE